MTEKAPTTDSNDIRSYVRQRYGDIAEKTTPSSVSSCCGDSSTAAACCCGGDQSQALIQISRLYETPEVANLPDDVTSLSLGCGDPVALANLKPGQTVLDLGSGGGIDCFLAAQKVGERGRVIGVDMTSQMIERARQNQAKLGVTNVEFRLGEIEHLPVADHSVDVIISNCVINLSPDKPQVFREAFRVLKPGGALAVSDIVTDGPLPETIKQSISAWAGCVAGAMEAGEFMAALEAAGFVDIQLTPVYWEEAMFREALAQLNLERKTSDGRQLLAHQEGEYIESHDLVKANFLSKEQLVRAVYSAKIAARKP